jgi:hypothetical protein
MPVVIGCRRMSACTGNHLAEVRRRSQHRVTLHEARVQVGGEGSVPLTDLVLSVLPLAVSVATILAAAVLVQRSSTGCLTAPE